MTATLITLVEPEDLLPGTVCTDCREPWADGVAAVRYPDRWATRGGIRAYSVICTSCAANRPPPTNPERS